MQVTNHETKPPLNPDNIMQPTIEMNSLDTVRAFAQNNDLPQEKPTAPKDQTLSPFGDILPFE